ncbi:hypothetical protein ACLIJR_00950 [Hydrogenophaga sp. XSHU_21]
MATNLSSLAFDFFFWFSRFEFALKENGYLKSHSRGAKAEPGWKEFVDKWHSTYILSSEACALLAAKPEQQIVGPNDELKWREVDLTKSKSDLSNLVLLLKTVRNNLFHGGKHGGAGWDDPYRTEILLSSGIAVLNQLAQLASIEADYKQYY